MVEAEVEATSSTSPEVGADAGARRGRPRFLFLRLLHKWVKGSNHLHERKGSSFFFVFGWNLSYIPVAPDSFGATDCPRSRVLILIQKLVMWLKRVYVVGG